MHPLSPFLLLLLTLTTARPLRNNLCLNNIDCPISTFCNTSTALISSPECTFLCPLPAAVCLPRLKLNTPCPVASHRCAIGLYCALFIRRTPIDRICLKQALPGRPCRLGDRSCTHAFYCSEKTRKCGPRTTGRAGDLCQGDSDCIQEDGFYCNSDPNGRIKSRCAPKIPDGSPCSLGSNFSCRGFCVVAPSGRSGVCVRRREVGERCIEDNNCHVVRTDPTTRSVPSLCVHGRCANEQTLLLVPGAPCSNKLDLCDPSRGLRCKRGLCVDTFMDECVRGRKDSICDSRKSNVPVVCRPKIGIFSEKELGGVDMCLRQFEVVSRGGICSWEYARCEKGTACVRARGVQRSFPFRQWPGPLLGYCMKLVGEGKNCAIAFDTACKPGLACVKGVCQKGMEDPEVPITRSGLDVDCSMQECATGLVCVQKDGGLFCELPTRTVKKGKNCFNTATEQRVRDSLSFNILSAT